MSSEIIFYHNPQSRSRIAHWMLEEVGAHYRVVLVDFEKKEHKKPEFLALNPMGKLPAIVHRGTVVTESGAIVAYLADAFPSAGLAPDLDDPARGTYLRWMFFGAACVEPAVVDRMLSRPAPERKSALGYGSYEDTLDALEKAITPGPFVLGERFSAADVFLGSQLGWGMMTRTIEPRPSFTAYQQRFMQRPAFQRAMAKNNELLAQLQAIRS
jgi:glutathione S-transferase